MKFKEAKKYKGREMTILEMDNLFSPHDNISLFGCTEGGEAIEELIKKKESNFSYTEDNEYDNLGYRVEFSLIGDAPKSSEFRDCKDAEIKITNIWEH